MKAWLHKAKKIQRLYRVHCAMFSPQERKISQAALLPVPAIGPAGGEAALQESSRLLSLCCGSREEARKAMAETQAALPVNHVKNDILDAIEQNQVVRDDKWGREW